MERIQRPLSAAAQQAIDAIRRTLDSECQNLKPEEYRDVLKEFAADVDGHLEQLNEQHPDLFD